MDIYGTLLQEITIALVNEVYEQEILQFRILAAYL